MAHNITKIDAKVHANPDPPLNVNNNQITGLVGLACS